MRQLDAAITPLRRRLSGVSLALALGVLAPAEALTAQTRDSPWIVRGGGLWLKPTGDEAGAVDETPIPVPEASTRQQLSSDLGFGLEVEYLVKRKLGIEVALLAGDIGADVTLDTGSRVLMGQGDLGVTALTVGLNYHVTPGARADLYGGLFLHASSYDDVTYRFPDLTAVWRIEDDDGYGYRAGLDVPFGHERRWIVAIGARHFRGPLDVKPVVLSVGAGYRF